MEPECKVRLRVFEGPLDLLLHLINRNKLDITDIPISLVTAQYLEYLSYMKALNIEVAAEYLVMAATLMHIKSKMLLPRNEDALGEEDDPRLEITTALMELKRAKEYADVLEGQPLLGRDVFTTGLRFEEDGEGFDTSHIQVSLIDLVDAFKRVLKGGPVPHSIEIERAEIDLDQRMDEISAIVEQEGKVSFFSLFYENMDRLVVIVTFLAILELAKMGRIRLFQDHNGADIILWKRVEDSR